MTFVHLHVHSEYSMLDATTRISDIVSRAKEDGSGTIALTDHNNMFGAVDFQKAATRQGVKPIFGAEVGIVEKDRTDPEIRRTPTIVLLCENLQGYRNLCFLLSRAYMDSPQRAPQARIDRALLEAHSEGLIALSGGLAGEIPQLLLRGREDDARRLARRYQGLFGRERFYIEIVRNGITEQERVNAGLEQLAEELEIPMVAAADSHYTRQEDAAAHEILMCIQLGRALPTLDTQARITDLFHLATAEEMKARYEDLPEAIENTVKIAGMCDVVIPLGETFLPTYPIPEGFDPETYLDHIAERGLDARLERMRELGEAPDEAVYRERLRYELDVIHRMGFPGYFLIVWDFIDWAKESDIPVGPGRGSGAGSLVAYALRITDIDPIRYSLLFERFLNPERVSMPDFDIDFCMNRRDRVMQYVTDKYGEDNVGQIITYGTMRAKAVIRDVARALAMTFGEADRAAKLIPDDLNITLKKAFEVEKRLSALADEDPRYAKLFEYALILEGLNRQPGMHAAGIVIGDKPLWEYVPLYAVRDSDDRLVRITQFSKDEVEEAGLVKFDFLGLTTLTVVDDAVRMINTRLKEEGEPLLDISAIPLDDPEVFRLISAAQTTGVFQLESSGFKDLLRKLRPDCIEDIIAAVALYRPGPLQSGMVDSFIRRKHGEERVAYPHPNLEEVLKETYGVMVYQEQIMSSASILAGFSLGQADLLRRAMGNKRPEEMAQQRAVFTAGCAERGVDEAKAGEIFDTIEKFAGYGFNKSHSAAYGFITYQTAWLKARYPVEFMAANLTSAGDNTDKVVRFIAECREMGLTVLPPSINLSSLDFTAVSGAIRFGLRAVKGIGSGAVEAILDARHADGPFEGLYDFCERVDLRRVNKRVMEALIRSGALDEFGETRRALFEEIDRAIERGQGVQRDKAAGQFSLFGELVAAPQVEAEKPVILIKDEWPDKLLLAFEKQCLGFYVSGHPLDTYANDLGRLGTRAIASLDDIDPQQSRESISVAGVIASARERVTKSGNRIAFLQLEDLTGQIEVMVFTRAYESFEPYLNQDEPLVVMGRLVREGETPEESELKIRAEGCRLLRDVRHEHTQRAYIHMDGAEIQDAHLEHLQGLLSQEEGVPVDFLLRFEGRGEVQLSQGAGWGLPLDEEVVAQVERLVGKGAVRFA